MSTMHIVTFTKPLDLHDVAQLHSREYADAAALENLRLLQSNFHEKMNMIKNAGILEGMTVHSEMEFTGNIVVSGPQEKIDALKEFLTLKDLGFIEEGADEIVAKGANPVIV